MIAVVVAIAAILLLHRLELRESESRESGESGGSPTRRESAEPRAQRESGEPRDERRPPAPQRSHRTPSARLPSPRQPAPAVALPDGAIEVDTPWPEVLPCARFASLAASSGYDFTPPLAIAWQAHGGDAIRARSPFRGAAIALGTSFHPGASTRLHVARDLDQYQAIDLDLTCADGGGSIHWACHRPFDNPRGPVSCEVDAAYATDFTFAPLTGTRLDRAIRRGERVEPSDAWARTATADLVGVANRLLHHACDANPARCTRKVSSAWERLELQRDTTALSSASIAKVGASQFLMFGARWGRDDELEVSCFANTPACFVNDHSLGWGFTHEDAYLGFRIDDTAFVALKDRQLIIGGTALSLRADEP